MAKKNILGKDQLKGFLFTERQVNENIAVVDGIVSPGRVDMGIGMVVTVDVRKEKTGRFNPSNHRHAKNFCICGFSSATSSRRVRVHCCENENFKKNIATLKETGIPAGEQFGLKDIKYVRCWIGTKRHEMEE